MTDPTELGGATSGSMNSSAGAGGLDSVVGAVDAALTSLDPQQGASAVAMVRRALDGAPEGTPGLGGISGTLERLQQLLSSGAADGAQVGPLLTSLSQQTRDAAGQAGPISGVLHQLAGRLDAVGAKLSDGQG